MSVLSGHEIRQRHIVGPCVDKTISHGMSYGLSVCGYDVRVAEAHVIEPGGFALASTVEHFEMPVDVVGIVHDKSSLARRGLAAQNTVLEPGWRGFLTLELTNHGTKPIRLEAGQPIAQILFHTVTGVVEPYSGKYQDQGQGPQPHLSEV